ncbi:putative nucleotide pyrophosphatase precursor [Spathaspora passalidarum NRRL Y-27907]|uniref:Putative nucleotide pyrophosphatase n=1 Tax=Spathaspora passalidarum (strain NRRL Y-27907 / 11-Y1) TaxID=619300 RepID=G3AE40_SPAPN|nr:putative nucleotide pyrophosphatase precursor [Spathaspora passalidarum NRRL Y-27907]EGW35574.1 putative nucleotide pyrophosphatase precursor [Spathaspora passalidarum NRRL Y-27907]
MSDNNQTPHPVDVPITDMDDPEDDIIFPDSSQPIINTDQEDTFLDSLDYEVDPKENKSMFTKFKALFTRSSDSNRSNYYEMVSSRNDDSFELDTDNDPSTPDSDNEEPINIRDYRVKLLENKLKTRTVVGVVLLMMIMATTLFLFKSTRGGDTIIYSGSGKRLLSNSTHDFYPTTIVISLDGFHPHYINAKDTPTMHNILVDEYGPPYMTPSFPSSTFPNHWTLVTGLYPSEHGIVGNTFFDPKLNKPFVNTNPKMGGLDPDFWRGGEPIWNTAERQNLTTAVHMWPGSEVPDGVGPKGEFDRYNGSELLVSKVDRVMEWIDKEIDSRPELILTYVPTIDQYGHKFGISGSNLTDALTYVDNFIDLMQRELHARNLDNIANMIIVSDHGMAQTSNERLLYLDDLIDLSKIDHIDGWPLFGLRPHDSADEIYNELTANLAKQGDNVTSNYHVYKVEDLPKEWQFGGQLEDHRFNYRLAPIWIIPEVGYSVTTHQQMKDYGNEYKPRGVHGYNNTHLLMRAIFLGSGPYFRSIRPESGKVKPFANTEVYNLICDSLNIIPSPNNGTNPRHVMQNSLPHDWSDDLIFPDLPYDVDHIVGNNATYDLLWRKNHKGTVPVSTNDHPLESMKSEESTISSLTTADLPKPSDFETTTGGLSNIVGHVLDDIEDGIEYVGEKVDDLLDGIFGDD